MGRIGENRDRNGKSRLAWAEQYWERRKGGGKVSGEDSRVGRNKSHTLLGDVLEYRYFYNGEGAD